MPQPTTVKILNNIGEAIAKGEVVDNKELEILKNRDLSIYAAAIEIIDGAQG